MSDLKPLTEAEATELLDWVSACQSSYHIDSTPGHRFGGLGSHLQENRDAVVEYVNGLIAARAQPAQAEARPCHVFNVTKNGALTEWEPTTMAFALPDGKHALYTAPQQTEAVPPGFKLLKDTSHDERSWPEDYSHENGCYSNTCINCLRNFTGYKRRAVCKVCDAAIAQQKGQPCR